MPGVVDKGQVPGKQFLAALWLHDTFIFSHVTQSSLFITIISVGSNLKTYLKFSNLKLSNFFPFIPDRDLENCLRKTRFITGEENHWVFVGDSRIQQVYVEILKMLDRDVNPWAVPEGFFFYNNSQLSLQISFFWRPIVDQNTIDLIHELGLNKSVPNLVVAGSGSWIIKHCNGSKSILENYSRNLRLVSEVTKQKLTKLIHCVHYSIDFFME
jgi:hypothetical protein